MKVLMLLYLAFHVFATLRQRNEISAWLLLAILTVAIQILARNTIGPYSILSIPYFAIGTLASAYKSKNPLGVNISIVPLAIYTIIALMLHMYVAVLVNAVAVASLTIILSHRKIKVPCPAILSSLTFDIYLVHNKVLMTGRTYTEEFSFWQFAIYTAIAALLFHYARTSLLRSNPR